MTNTERLIATLESAKKSGANEVTFYVGRYTGNGPSVVAALRRRGFKVVKQQSASNALYRLFEQ